jgi:uncharacterized protein YdhG (YjbR/CyaY superfamily)
MKAEISNVDEYIKTFPKETQPVLEKIRAITKEKAPESIESIAYGMPAYRTHGKPLVYFAGYKNHIGLYATPTGHEKFAKELVPYKKGRGSVQFPLNKPIPYDLISDIVEFRVKENLALSRSTNI